MPGITVDLLDLNGVAQVHENSAAFRPSIKEKIFRWLVLLAGQLAVVQLFNPAAILIGVAGNDSELHVCRCVASGRWRDIFEPKAWPGFVVSLSLNNDFDFRP